MSHFRKWGAVWILLALFVGSWLAQFLNQLAKVANEAKEHGQSFSWSEFWPEFFASTFENWQSEFLQLIVQAILLASFLGQKRFFQADHNADKDDVQKILQAIEGTKNET
jgi:hypothetical protein